jgi:transposase
MGKLMVVATRFLLFCAVLLVLPAIAAAQSAPLTVKRVCAFVRAHQQQIRVFFLPKHSPELNPDEHVWEEFKNKRLRKRPIYPKRDLKKRLPSALSSLQRRTRRIIFFFQLPDTQYATV